MTKQPTQQQAKTIEAIKKQIAILIEARRQCHGLPITQGKINEDLDTLYNYLYFMYKEIYNN